MRDNVLKIEALWSETITTKSYILSTCKFKASYSDLTSASIFQIDAGIISFNDCRKFLDILITDHFTNLNLRKISIHLIFQIYLPNLLLVYRRLCTSKKIPVPF